MIFISFLILSCYNIYTDIREGVGIDGFLLHNTTFEQLINKLGKPDTMYIKADSVDCTDFFKPHIAHYEFSHIVFQYVYEYKKKGMRFIYEDYQGTLKFDEQFKKLKIEVISLFYPFLGQTRKGIILNKSTMKDILRKYGKNKNKVYFSDHTIHYPHRNIAFRFYDYKHIQWVYLRLNKRMIVNEIVISNYSQGIAK